ncbi:hypothetical protein B0T14DRAFT_604317 [Immersiella caudata]|uniref:Uncharacterized protein n=1 Tax=Immersiella caudata TaxID=314043 RepID=A0AA39WSH8_9PEZI|nr:hypothetical protein B0T14DRAFT_604317 [Immersiella caudata]
MQGSLWAKLFGRGGSRGNFSFLCRRDDDETLTVEKLLVRYFIPTQAYVKLALEADGVAFYVRSTKQKKPVYLVTGLVWVEFLALLTPRLLTEKLADGLVQDFSRSRVISDDGLVGGKSQMEYLNETHHTIATKTAQLGVGYVPHSLTPFSAWTKNRVISRSPRGKNEAAFLSGMKSKIRHLRVLRTALEGPVTYM